MMSRTYIQKMTSKKILKRSAIVLVPFPFTDLTIIKLRPVLVISCYRQDIIVVGISSVVGNYDKKTDIIIQSSHADFSRIGLKQASVIKCAKIATLDKAIVVGTLGIVPSDLQRQVDQKLRAILSI